MVHIASFRTQYRNRTTVSAKRKVAEMRRPNKTWLVTWTLPVSIALWVVATVAACTKKGAFTDDACASNNACCAVPRGGAFPDDACASAQSRCAVSKKKFHIYFYFNN